MGRGRAVRQALVLLHTNSGLAPGGNARSVLADFRREGERVWSKFSAPRHETLWYYRAVTQALAEGDPSPLVEELDRVVTELERLARNDA